MISTHAPEADQIGAGVLQRPKSSRYRWSENGEGLTATSDTQMKREAKSSTMDDSSPEEALKLALIRDAINGAAQGANSPAEFLRTLVNYAVLLIQQPCCISFWVREGKAWKIRYMSFRDDQYLGDACQTGPRIEQVKEIAPLPGRRRHGEFGVSVHKIVPIGGEGEPMGRLVSDLTWTKRCQQLFVVADQEHLGCLSPMALEKFFRALDDPDFHQMKGHHPPTLEGKNLKHMAANDALLLAVRERIHLALSRAYESLRTGGQVNLEQNHADGTRHSILNLFCAFRWISGPEKRCGHFTYEAGVLLERRQREGISQLLAGHLATKEVKEIYPTWDQDFERAVGASGRTVFDSVVANGLIDFSLSGGMGEAGANRDHQGGEEDLARQRVEKVVYKRLLSKGKDYVVMSIPILVGGTVWMALYTFAEQSLQGWYHCYALLRDTISRTEETLRYFLEGAFIDMVANEAEGAFGLPDSEFIGTVNKKWEALGQLFPFEIPQMHRERPLERGGHGFSLKIPTQTPVWVSLEPNRFFSVEMVGSECNLERLERGLQARANQHRLRTELANNLVHAVKTKLRKTQETFNLYAKQQYNSNEVNKINSEFRNAIAFATAVSDMSAGKSPRSQISIKIEELIHKMHEWLCVSFQGLKYNFLNTKNEWQASLIQTNELLFEALLIEVVNNAFDHGIGEPLIQLECGETYCTLRVENRFKRGGDDEKNLLRIKGLRDGAIVAKSPHPDYGGSIGVGVLQVLILQKCLGLPPEDWFKISSLDLETGVVTFEANVGRVLPTCSH